MSLTDESATSPEGDEPPATAAPRPRSHAARNAAIVVGVVLVALIAVLATRRAAEPASTRIVGQAAPEVTGRTLDGSTFRLSNRRGEWVLVNFFATWCVPCRIEHPELVKFAAEHANDPVQVVSVAFSDQADAIQSFFAENGGTWPVLPADTGSIALDYGITGVPETYVVAPNGQVIARLEGVTQAALDQIIDDAGGMEVASSG